MRADVSAQPKACQLPSNLPGGRWMSCHPLHFQLSYNIFTAPHPLRTQGMGTGSAAGGMLPLSMVGSHARAGENVFHAILVKTVNSVDYITLVWEQVL